MTPLEKKIAFRAELQKNLELLQDRIEHLDREILLDTIGDKSNDSQFWDTRIIWGFAE